MPCCAGRRRQVLEIECIVAVMLTVTSAILIFNEQPTYLVACSATGILAAAVGAVAGTRESLPLAMLATVAAVCQGIFFGVVGLLTIRDANNKESVEYDRFGLQREGDLVAVIIFLKIIFSILGAALFIFFATSHVRDSGSKNVLIHTSPKLEALRLSRKQPPGYRLVLSSPIIQPSPSEVTRI